VGEAIGWMLGLSIILSMVLPATGTDARLDPVFADHETSFTVTVVSLVNSQSDRRRGCAKTKGRGGSGDAWLGTTRPVMMRLVLIRDNRSVGDKAYGLH
jgi:hypothetical protein